MRHNNVFIRSVDQTVFIKFSLQRWAYPGVFNMKSFIILYWPSQLVTTRAISTNSHLRQFFTKFVYKRRTSVGAKKRRNLNQKINCFVLKSKKHPDPLYLMIATPHSCPFKTSDPFAPSAQLKPRSLCHSAQFALGAYTLYGTAHCLILRLIC